MSLKPRDPLLVTARFMLGLAMGISALATVAMALLIPAVVTMRDKVLQYVQASGTPSEVTWGIVSLLVLSVALALFGFFFFRHLYRIVGTVGEGDPFVPMNAMRLRAMGWISVAAHVVAVPATGIGRWLESTTDRIHATAEIPLSGLLLAVVLFVLARVFREGTRLRDEVEGTV